VVELLLPGAIDTHRLRTYNGSPTSSVKEGEEDKEDRDGKSFWRDL
jgi:hypothetical protein